MFQITESMFLSKIFDLVKVLVNFYTYLDTWPPNYCHDECCDTLLYIGSSTNPAYLHKLSWGGIGDDPMHIHLGQIHS